jgi:hypothetical protein
MKALISKKGKILDEIVTVYYILILKFPSGTKRLAGIPLRVLH